MYMWASSITIFQETRRISTSQEGKFFFPQSFKKIKINSINSYFNVWFTTTIISNSSIYDNFNDGRIGF